MGSISDQIKTLYKPENIAIIMNVKGVQIPFIEKMNKAAAEKEFLQAKGIMPLALKNNHMLYIPDVSADLLFCSILEWMKFDNVHQSTVKEYGVNINDLPKLGVKSVIAAPLYYDPYANKDPLGVVIIGSSKGNAWNAIVDLPTLRALVNSAALPLKHILGLK
jgi:hypothetical protein